MFQQAILQVQAGDLAAAVATLEKLLRQTPDHTEGLRLLGKIKLGNGDVATGTALMERAFATAPDHADLRYEIGVACLQAGAFERAIDLFREQLAHSPTQWECAFNLAWVLNRLERQAEALPHLEACARLVPANGDVWFNLGNTLSRLDCHARAAEAYDRSLAAGGLKPAVLANAIHTRLRLEDMPNAIMLVEKLSRIAPDSPEYAGARGEVAMANRHWAEATGYFRLASGQAPEQTRYRLWLAVAAVRADRQEEAARICRTILALDGSNAAAYATLGEALGILAGGEPPSAEAAAGMEAAGIFERFGRWEGRNRRDMNHNFLGVMTRSSFYTGNPAEPATASAEASGEGHHLQSAMPPLDEEYFEWLDLLEAVAAARERFTMVELGAGFGRWLVNGHAAVNRLSRLPCILVGVEADTAHMTMMATHFRDNGIDPAAHHLIEAAVTDRDREVLFQEGDPFAWWGQSVQSSGAVTAEYRTISKPGIALSTLLKPFDFVDLIDADIQGEELKVFVAARDSLARKVRRVHIGTHGRGLEYGLRELFGSMGWRPVWDFGCDGERDTPFGRTRFQDGVQSWINPVL